jgi:hypothetical protein
VKSRLLLDVVVAQSTAVLELLAGKDQALLVRRDTADCNDLSVIGYLEQRQQKRTPPYPGSWP